MLSSFFSQWLISLKCWERNTFEYERYCCIWKLRDMRFFMPSFVILPTSRAEYAYVHMPRVIKYTYVKLITTSTRYFGWLFSSNWSNLFSHFGCIKIFQTLYVYISMYIYLCIYIKYISFRNYLSSSVMRHVRRRVARCVSVFGISAIYILRIHRLATELAWFAL